MNQAKLDREAILEIDKHWARAALEGRDIEYILSFWSDDAKVFVPGQPVIIGKTAIRQFIQNSLAMPGFSIRWETSEVVVSADGSLAYATGTNKMTVNDSQGKKITMNGKAVTVWRKDESGSWKCVIDIWNDDPQKAE
jgi:ketosteroid isomerase-like protein